MQYGNIELLNEPSISVVGTRQPTDYGIKYCKKFCKEFIARDIVIVSGMAVGIDEVAHKTAINYGGKTIAVLPSGLRNVYPKENMDLFNLIIENDGLAISEYSENIAGISSRFLERNRIVAALGECLLVVEAKYRSGTSVTAGLARKQDKSVFAVPRKFR